MTTAPIAKRVARTAGGRKTQNKLARYAGGAVTNDFVDAAKEIKADGGITAGLATLAAADGQRFIDAPTAAIAVHAYNAPARSIVRDTDKWNELLTSVRAAGVQVPILLVSREAFATARPNLVADVRETDRYVVVYGHRRLAVAKSIGLATIPAVVDDSVLADDGDLEAMANENLGREDPTELEQAEMFARFSEAGLSQRAIAEKAGVSQPTVQRRMRLLLLTPEVRSAVESGAISAAEAGELAKTLPYGPARIWQDRSDPDQNTEERHADQLAAYSLVMAGATPDRAAKRMLAERHARDRAAAEGVDIVDPKQRFGADHQRHAIVGAAPAGTAVVAAIDTLQGGLVYYPAQVPDRPLTDSDAGHHSTPGTAATDDHKQHATAAKARRAACQRLVASPPPRDKMLPFLAQQYALGLTTLAASQAGWTLAYKLANAAGVATAAADDVATYRALAAQENDLRRQLEITWASVVAAYEINATDKARGHWTPADVTYLQLLQDRANYTPTPWEHARLKAVSLQETR